MTKAECEVVCQAVRDWPEGAECRFQYESSDGKK